MGWLALLFLFPFTLAAIIEGLIVGTILFLIAMVLILPPLWKRLKAEGKPTYPGMRWSGTMILGFVAMAIAGAAYSESPEGKAAEAKRRAAVEMKAEAEAKAALAEQQERERKKSEEIASGEHCLSGWDGSFPRLKEAVKRSLRNPRSFEHIDTVRSPVDKQGKFGLIMTYRAENGFGGMNVEVAGIEVEAKTCNFKQVSPERLAKRLAQHL
ncbi:MAG: hypothetical protein AB7E05_07640 [Sphingobium sp.]